MEVQMGFFFVYVRDFTFTDKTCFSLSVVKLKSEPVCSGFSGLNAGLEPLFWERRAASGRMGNLLPDEGRSE